MHDEPTPNLVDLLARLKLATPEQVRAVRPLARGLARDLPLFESVWVDALVQARLLTPFQATELNAGRGEQLRVGPYVLRSALGERLGWAECYLAAHTETKRTVHLLVARRATARQADRQAAELQVMVEIFQTMKESGAGDKPLLMREVGAKRQAEKARNAMWENVAKLGGAGANEGTLWAAFELSNGTAASQWTAWHGRLPPAVVWEIARQMAAALAKLEAAAIGHGDIAASSLMLNEKGEVRLARCGVRGIFRPDETESCESLPIEAFDYLAPEKLEKSELDDDSATQARRLNLVGDMYACGCLWWHLLTGRAPMAGGDHAAKIRAMRAGKISDLQRLAPDVSKPLAAAIERCTQRDPAQRPASFTELVELLGASTSAGRRRLADVLAGSGRRTASISWSWRARSGLQKAGAQMIAAAACVVLLAAATWPLWRPRHAAIEHAVAARTPAAAVAANVGKITKVVATAAVDPSVRQVNFQTTDNPPAAAKTTPERTVIELSSDTEIAGTSLRLQNGAVVRGKDSKRVRIAVPPNGLSVTADNVRFENIDFLWRQRPEAITSPDRHALVDLRSAHVEFVGCTFQAVAAGSFELPPAIRMTGSSQHAALAPAVQVRLQQCALRGVACGVECALAGPAAIEVSNSLHLGRGALVRFSQPRHGDSPALVTLEHVTLRGASSVIEIDTGDSSEEFSQLNINASGCVLAPEGGGLLLFDGRQVKPSIGGRLKGLEWSGEGSLTPPGTAVAVWRHDEALETLPDDELSMDGLVASAMEFMGEVTNNPATSRLKKWLAPLQSDLTPGIADDLPKLAAGEWAIASTAKQSAGAAKQK